MADGEFFDAMEGRQNSTPISRSHSGNTLADVIDVEGHGIQDLAGVDILLLRGLEASDLGLEFKQIAGSEICAETNGLHGRINILVTTMSCRRI